MKKAIMIVALLVTAGCSQHGDLPAPLAVDEPQMVTNFTVTNVGGGDYDLSWEIGDATLVDHYNVYVVLDPFTGELSDEPLESTDTFLGVSLGFEIPLLTFGVTVVSTEHVEGEIVFATSL